MNSKAYSPSPPDRRGDPRPCWEEIDTVLLDMDGTLLDRHFDDYFWEHYIPEIYATRHRLDLKEARQLLLTTYRSVESTLQWTDLDYWSQRLGLDFARLKANIGHMVAVHPGVLDFLAFLHHHGKQVHLVTNAHPEALRIKMERSRLAPWFHTCLCSREVGAAKEQELFWQRLGTFLPHRKERTLFVDDTEKVLDAAASYGISHLLHVAKPSSRLPAAPSRRYPAINSFDELFCSRDSLPNFGKPI